MKFHIGMRNIKTGIAVGLSMLVCMFIPNSLMFVASISAIHCVQDNVHKSIRLGISRVIGTLIGGLLGVLCVLADQYAGLEYLFLITVPVAVVLSIALCTFIGEPAACVPSCIVIVAIMMSRESDARYVYAFYRMVETIVGVVIAVLVNKILPNKHENKNQDEAL